MNFKSLLFVALATGFGLAQAESASLAFNVDELPHFSLPLASSTGGDFAGRWLDANQLMASGVVGWKDGAGTFQEAINGLDEQGFSPNTLNGEPLDPEGHSVTVDAPNAPVNAVLSVGARQMQAEFQFTDNSQFASSLATVSWGRGFEINPQTTVTLSGLMQRDGQFSDLPGQVNFNQSTPAGTHFDNSALLSFTGDNNLGHYDLNLNAMLYNCNSLTPCSSNAPAFPDNGNAFSYSIDPDGRLTLNITNRTDAPMYGSLSIEMNASAVTELAAVNPINLSAPVPELPVSALMALGLGALAFIRHRRRYS
jgi:hypothetical protein